MNTLPDSTFLPPFYFTEAGGVQKIDKHRADFTSPELKPVNPAPFTATFIYGSYKAK